MLIFVKHRFMANYDKALREVNFTLVDSAIQEGIKYVGKLLDDSNVGKENLDEYLSDFLTSYINSFKLNEFS